MIEADGVDDVEMRQIIPIGREVAMPGDDIERAMVQRRAPQAPAEFLNELEIGGDMIKCRRNLFAASSPVGASTRRRMVGFVAVSSETVTQPQREPNHSKNVVTNQQE